MPSSASLGQTGNFANCANVQALKQFNGDGALRIRESEKHLTGANGANGVRNLCSFWLAERSQYLMSVGMSRTSGFQPGLVLRASVWSAPACSAGGNGSGTGGTTAVFAGNSRLAGARVRW